MKVLGTGDLDAFEKGAYDTMIPQLQTEIQKGINFVKSPPTPPSS
jgi:hypothetical protein